MNFQFPLNWGRSHILKSNLLIKLLFDLKFIFLSLHKIKTTLSCKAMNKEILVYEITPGKQALWLGPVEYSFY